MKLIGDFTDQERGFPHHLSLFLLRVTFGGAMIIGHGQGKLEKLMSGEPIKFMNFLGLGEEVSLTLVVFAEFFCAILLVIGLFTKYASIPLIFTMGVALFVAHIADPFSEMEMSLLYLIPYIVVYLLGPGKFSLDYAIWNRS